MGDHLSKRGWPQNIERYVQSSDLQKAALSLISNKMPFCCCTRGCAETGFTSTVGQTLRCYWLHWHHGKLAIILGDLGGTPPKHKNNGKHFINHIKPNPLGCHFSCHQKLGFILRPRNPALHTSVVENLGRIEKNWTVYPCIRDIPLATESHQHLT